MGTTKDKPRVLFRVYGILTVTLIKGRRLEDQYLSDMLLATNSEHPWRVVSPNGKSVGLGNPRLEDSLRPNGQSFIEDEALDNQPVSIQRIRFSPPSNLISGQLVAYHHYVEKLAEEVGGRLNREKPEVVMVEGQMLLHSLPTAYHHSATYWLSLSQGK